MKQTTCRIRRHEFREFTSGGYVGEPVGQLAQPANNSQCAGKRCPRSKYQTADYLRKK